MRKYWLAFVAVIVASFIVLGGTGVRVYQSAPPIPDRVVTTDGHHVVTATPTRAARSSCSSRT
jgi:nitric oxide reductase subunit B